MAGKTVIIEVPYDGPRPDLTKDQALDVLRRIKVLIADLRPVAGLDAPVSDQPHYTYTGDGNCRSCGRGILWFTTPAGKKMPVDDNREATPRSLSRGDRIPQDEARDTILKACHFETCPKADQHRHGGDS